ncbi:DUF2971 domain-containing protein [Paralcaligenes ureilyticus]|uniref:DUF2971 family protein n=1 Tax=Paralcaligenes ureilyticus TaxID=627131 RepID=A0A4R3MDB6_9BURK|nr:DUF2971 domain-containing protein [Paralcaligenes ureilyticus]TCT10903.1 DUF2971 family protein [Paralcaligenes ureilyticus]
MILYHYCSPEAFLSIIQGKKLWLSRINNMSDYMEGSWIVGIIDEILPSLAQEFGREAAQQVVGQYNRDKFSPYVCCFSEDGDMLSQWRGYANDGYGFSIGFNSEFFPSTTGIPRQAFTEETKLWLCKVEYQLDVQQNFIRRLLELAMRDVTAKAGEIPLGVQEQIAYMSAKMSAKNNGISLPEIPCGGLHELIRQLTGYAVIAKNPAFHEEREHRLIHAPLVIADRTTNQTTDSRFEISDPKHRVTNNRICAYYEFDLSEYINKGIIAEIVKGPKNGTSDNDLAAIFGKMERTDIPIRQSKASYR